MCQQRKKHVKLRQNWPALSITERDLLCRRRFRFVDTVLQPGPSTVSLSPSAEKRESYGLSGLQPEGGPQWDCERGAVFRGRVLGVSILKPVNNKLYGTDGFPLGLT